MIKLNLGCGRDYRLGYINIDFIDKFNPDMVIDLRKKLPFKDNSVDEVLCYHILEHFYDDELQLFLMEIYRICKNGALFKCEFPHYLNPNSCALTHKKQMSTNSLRLFDYDRLDGNSSERKWLFSLKDKKVSMFRPRMFTGFWRILNPFLVLPMNVKLIYIVKKDG